MGGADGVRGFSEGSETGERGGKLNLELYAPAWNMGGLGTRGLLFADAGRIINEGTDPKQQQGDWRLHASLSGTF